MPDKTPRPYIWCPRCRTWLPPETFSRNRARATGRYPYCKPCSSAYYYAVSKPRQKARRLLREYGLTEAGMQQALASQGSACAICARPLPLVEANVDHDHVSGSCRGLLCRPCNQGLGHFGDNADRLRLAAAYLEAHR